jgi:type II secretory pathway pseudopilin PulG
MLVIVVVAFAALLATLLSGTSGAVEREQRTAAALGAARDALIAYAASDSNRPGDLPCPDLVTNISGTNIPNDGSSERLWYVVSRRFSPHPSAGMLNSDTPGELSITGAVQASNVIALVIAPGAPLAGQDRLAGPNLPSQYLENENGDGDDTYAVLPPSTDFNDRVLMITPDMLFPAVEKRVAREARYCLEAFSTQSGANRRFPWAAPVTDTLNYAGTRGTLFGRIPRDDTYSVPAKLVDTSADLGADLRWPMSARPGIRCFDHSTWWGSWKDLLFYHVAYAYAPAAGSGGPCGSSCLTVNGVKQAKAVVIVAGRALSVNPDQSSRAASKTFVSNYLETDPSSGINNAAGSGTYARASAVLTGTATFNDKLECLQETGDTPC